MGTARACVFCGSAGGLTREHVFGEWLTGLGLDPAPVAHAAGPLNRIGRELGMRSPFRQTVRKVCSACNNGWMSRLEVVAKRVLTPFILGQPEEINAADADVVTAWVQKTALTAMLVLSEDERANGKGLPPEEYRQLYQQRGQQRPLPASTFWIARYVGQRGFSVRVTPLAVRIAGLPEPDRPHGYAITVVLGQLLLHGLRFTTPSLQIEVSTPHQMARLWPVTGPVSWLADTAIDDGEFLDVASGKELLSAERGIDLLPWTPATELPASRPGNGLVQLPTICGKHVVYYPAALADEAMHGRCSVFATACECPTAYLIQTELDGAHCKAADTLEVIAELFEGLPGEEYLLQDEHGSFPYKRSLS